MLTWYRIVLYFALPLLLVRLLLRALRDRRYLERIPERLALNARVKNTGGVWVHAVSVGEVNAATPLVEALLKNHPRLPITVTTMTPTGADRVVKTFADRVEHRYLPYDFPGAMRRFLDALKPRVAVVMETELWPNLIHRCALNQVPMLYVNARLSKRSLRGYQKFHKLIAPQAKKINRFAAQSRADARRLIRLGAQPDAVSVTGNLKFDVVLPAGAFDAAQSVRRDFGVDRPVWVAGSTHDGEDAQILDAFARARKEFKSLLLVIVPRHPTRAGAVLRLCARRGHDTTLRSQTPGKLRADTEIHVADTMGELQLLIAAADLAFIGGSLTPVGGHNVLEASAAGVPVVFGRYMFNFAEIADLLLRNNAGIQVMNAGELADVVQRLLADPVLRDQYAHRGRELVEKNRGALQKVCALVEHELSRRC